jgi:hypothetical protein
MGRLYASTSIRLHWRYWYICTSLSDALASPVAVTMSPFPTTVIQAFLIPCPFAVVHGAAPLPRELMVHLGALHGADSQRESLLGCQMVFSE